MNRSFECYKIVDVKLSGFRMSGEHIIHDPSNQKSYTAIHFFNITARLAVAFAFFFCTNTSQCLHCKRKTVKLCHNKWPHHAKTCFGAYAQSDQGLHCPLTESLDTTECMMESTGLDDT